jgi:hypothetical protein
MAHCDPGEAGDRQWQGNRVFSAAPGSKSGLANLTYNFRRLVWLNGQAAPARSRSR